MKLLSVLPINPLRRIKRRLAGCCLLLVIGLLLACVLIFGLSFYLAQLAQAQAGDEAPQEALLLIDNSNSMFEKLGLGSDPDLLRIEAARLFITYFGVDSGGPPHRLGVIFFGGEARLVVPPAPLADAGRRAEMARLIGDPPRMAWTNPAAALSLARQTFAAGPPAGRRAVILLTDGKPESSNPPAAAEQEAAVAQLRAAAEEFAAEGVALFIILLQNEATDADPAIEQVYVPLWQDMAAKTPPGRFYRARRSEDLLDIYHDIVVALTGRQTAGVVVQARVDTETVKPVVVEPGLAQVTFVIRKSDPAMRVEVARPGGAALHPGQPGVLYGGAPGQSLEEIWAVTGPPPGRWLVRLSGQGTVTVWKDYLPAPATATATVTPSPAATLTPRPTATATPSPRATPSPVVTSTPTHTPSPAPRPTLTPAATKAVAVPVAPESPGDGLASGTAPAAPGYGWAWWLGLPAAAAAGGSWLWLQHGRSGPTLSGVLDWLAGTGPAAAELPRRVDLDRLNRREIRMGPAAGATLRLPSPSPDRPTPTVRLVARPDHRQEPGVALVVEDAAAGPVQVNNLPVSREWFLHDGDVITLGAYRFRYENLRLRDHFC